jgi:hypothetical protein
MWKLSFYYFASWLNTPITGRQAPSFPALLKILFLCSSWGRRCSLYHVVGIEQWLNMSLQHGVPSRIIDYGGSPDSWQWREYSGAWARRMGWVTAAFDATQLYRGDSWNTGRVIQRSLFILPCSANIFRLFVGNDWATHKSVTVWTCFYTVMWGSNRQK